MTTLPRGPGFSRLEGVCARSKLSVLLSCVTPLRKLASRGNLPLGWIGLSLGKIGGPNGRCQPWRDRENEWQNELWHSINNTKGWHSVDQRMRKAKSAANVVARNSKYTWFFFRLDSRQRILNAGMQRRTIVKKPPRTYRIETPYQQCAAVGNFRKTLSKPSKRRRVSCLLFMGQCRIALWLITQKLQKRNSEEKTSCSFSFNKMWQHWRRMGRGYKLHP